MSLKDILTKLAEETESFFLYNANGSHSPASLLNEQNQNYQPALITSQDCISQKSMNQGIWEQSYTG